MRSGDAGQSASLRIAISRRWSACMRANCALLCALTVAATSRHALPLRRRTCSLAYCIRVAVACHDCRVRACSRVQTLGPLTFTRAGAIGFTGAGGAAVTEGGGANTAETTGTVVGSGTGSGAASNAGSTATGATPGQGPGVIGVMGCWTGAGSALRATGAGVVGRATGTGAGCGITAGADAGAAI